MTRSYVRNAIIVRNNDGSALLVQAALVSIFLHGTTTPIPIYSTASGGSPLAQPLRSDSTGQIEFWADLGSAPQFDAFVSADGSTVRAGTTRPVTYAPFTEVLASPVAPLDSVDSRSLRIESVRSHGADNTGATDTSTAILATVAAAAGAPTGFPVGTYKVTTNLTIAGPVEFAHSAILRPAAGVTITFTGPVNAGAWQIFDTSAGGTIRFTADARIHPLVDWFGAVRGADSTAAFKAAIAALAWVAAGDALARTLYVLDGDYTINDELIATHGIVIEGQTSYGTRLVIGGSFPPDGHLIRFEKDGGYYPDENHTPGYGLRHLCLDGGGRQVVANAIRLDFVDRSSIEDVNVRYFRGATLTLARSCRENEFVDVKSYMCGSPATPDLNLVDTGTADGHNLNRFVNCDFAFTLGDLVALGASTSGVVNRNTFFVNCVFHGLTDYLDSFTDRFDGTVALTDGGASKQRIVVANARNVFFIGCRGLSFGRGQSLFHLIADPTVGGLSQNSVHLIGSAFYRGGYVTRTADSVDVAADTITFHPPDNAGGYLSTGHHLSVGSRVQVTGAPFPTPLAAATDYYAIPVTATTVKLATTRANAVAGVAIDLTVTGTVSLVQQDTGVTANAGTDALTAADHRMQTGARLYIASDGGAVPAGLAAATDYFAIRVDANTLKLATTRLNAEAGTAIDLTTAGTGALYVTPQDFTANVELGTFEYGSSNSLDFVPNRAMVRQEIGATTVLVSPANVLTGNVVERSDGQTGATTSFYGGTSIPNNAAYSSPTVGGTNVQLARVTNAGAAVVGNVANVAGIPGQLNGQTEVDLLVDLVQKFKLTPTQAIALVAMVAPGLSLNGTGGAGAVALPTQSAPPTPAAGIAAIYAGTTAGREELRSLGATGAERRVGDRLWEKPWALCAYAGAASVRVSGSGNFVSAGTVGNVGATVNGPMTSITSTASANFDTDVQGTAMWRRGAAADAFAGFRAFASIYFPDASYDSAGAATGSRIWGLVLSNATAASDLSSSDAPTAKHLCGFRRCSVDGGAADTNWQFVTCDGATQTPVDTGMPFTAQHLYRFHIWCPAGSTRIYWQVDDVTAGTSQTGSTTATLPSAVVGLAPWVILRTINATARVWQFDRIYTEADKG